MAKTILLADDSITIQKIVNLTFSGEGIDVVTVGNGDAAIKKLHEIDPDLVLADIFMPGKNGYEVCEYIKGHPEVQHKPVILLVGAFEPFDSNEAARVKADGHLTKPFEIKVLISAVNSLIGDREEENIQTDSSTDTDEGASPTAIIADSPAELEVGVEHTVESTSAESDVAPSPMAVSSAVSATGLLTTEVPVADADLDTRIDVEPDSIGNQPLAVAGKARDLIGDSDDLDPLGLFANDQIIGVGLDEAGGTDSDSKELVVDIWESRSSSLSEPEVLPEIVGHQQPPPASPVIVVQESASVESGIEGSLPSPGRGETQEPATSTEVDAAQLVDIVVQRVMEKLSREVIEKIAWEVVPDLAEIIIKEQVETHFKASGRA